MIGKAVNLSEAEAGPLAGGLGREEWLEGAAASFVGHARPIIRNRNADVVAGGRATVDLRRHPLGPKRNGYGSRRPSDRITGIDHEVEQRGLEPVPIGKAEPNPFRGFHPQGDALPRRAGQQTPEIS